MTRTARLPLILAVLGSAFPVTTALAGRPAAHSAATHMVKLQNISIHPTRLVIRSGDHVTWQFLDAPIHSPHTITPVSRAGGLRFKGSGARESGSYSVTLRKHGTYFYECTIHTFMQGRIVVR